MDQYGITGLGNQPLYYASLCGHPKVVRFLLQAGAPFDIIVIFLIFSYLLI